MTPTPTEGPVVVHVDLSDLDPIADPEGAARETERRIDAALDGYGPGDLGPVTLSVRAEILPRGGDE